MLSELPDLENSVPKVITFWPPMNEEEEVSKAMPKETANKCITEGKVNATAKKTCICAPTSHAGSFRCHLHRTNNAPPPPKLSSRCFLEDNNGRKSSQGHGQLQLLNKINLPKMTRP